MDGRTHWDGCWREHLDCAVARVEALENREPSKSQIKRISAMVESAEIKRLEAENARLRDALEAVDAWDLDWACGLDENVERIKDMARAALNGEG